MKLSSAIWTFSTAMKLSYYELCFVIVLKNDYLSEMFWEDINNLIDHNQKTKN